MPQIVYGVDARDVKKGVSSVNRQLGSISKTAKSVGGKLGTMFSPMTAAVAGLATGFGALEAIKIGDKFTNVASQLEYLTGSTAAAEEAQEKLYQMSQRTMTSFTDNAAALNRLALASDQTGLNMDENIQVLGAINRMMLQTGTSSMEASAAMLQLGQALASGKLQGDEFRSMAENAPGVMNQLAKSLGVTRGELKEMSSQGELTSEVLGRAFLEMSQSADSMASDLPITVSGMWTKVVNATQRMWDAINDETGILGYLSAGLDNLASWVEENTPRVVLFFTEMRDKAVQAWPQIKQFFIEYGQYLTEVYGLFKEVWPIMSQAILAVANAARVSIPFISQLISWVTKLIEKLKVVADYTPLAALARAAGTVSGGGSILDALGNAFDVSEQAAATSFDGGTTNNTNNFYISQQMSRSDVTGIVQELNRQEARR